jgi:polysaccharide export outer membrane protein
MFIKFRLAILGVLGTLLLFSCVTRKQMNEVLYLSDTLDTASVRIIKQFEPVIEIGDRLSVQVNALNRESAAPYNYQASALGIAQAGYLVEKDGTVLLPQLGRLSASGKTRQQLTDTLTLVYNKYLNDPVVNIQFLNFKVIMAGEVTRPGPITIPDGKLNIFEALTMAGDLDVTARKDNILVIRETNGLREFGRVNLNSHKVFNSPYYHLKQNDLVYVEMTKNKLATANSAGTQRNVRFVTTALSIVSTLIVLITRF